MRTSLVSATAEAGQGTAERVAAPVGLLHLLLARHLTGLLTHHHLLRHLLGHGLQALLKLIQRLGLGRDRRAGLALLERLTGLPHGAFRPAQGAGDLAAHLAELAHQLRPVPAAALPAGRRWMSPGPAGPFLAGPAALPLLSALTLLPALAARHLTLLALLSLLSLLTLLALLSLLALLGFAEALVQQLALALSQILHLLHHLAGLILLTLLHLGHGAVAQVLQHLLQLGKHLPGGVARAGFGHLAHLIQHLLKILPVHGLALHLRRDLGQLLAALQRLTHLLFHGVQELVERLLQLVHQLLEFLVGASRFSASDRRCSASRRFRSASDSSPSSTRRAVSHRSFWIAGTASGVFIQIEPRHGGAERQEDDDVVVELIGAGGNDAEAPRHLLAAGLGPERQLLALLDDGAGDRIAELALRQDQRHVFGGAGLAGAVGRRQAQRDRQARPRDGASGRGSWCCGRSSAARRGGEAEARPECGRCPVPPRRRSDGRRR